MQGAGLVLTSYQNSLTRAMDITANNIANINTTGFKRETLSFDSFLIRPATDQTFQFAIENGTYRDAAQGPTVMTGNPLDIAIQGAGYLPVQTKNGIRYTRAGAFQLNQEGDLVTAAGDQVLGDGDQTLNFPADARDIVISSDGTITARTGTGTTPTQIGRLRVSGFKNERGLVSVGGNLYKAEETPEPQDNSKVVQGAIEQSNVQSVTEMTKMIEVSRTYQQVTRLLELENERQNTAILKLGRATA